MALPDHERPRLNEAEYLAMEQVSSIRHEFIAGYAYAMTGASERHIEISGNTFASLHRQLRATPCKVYNGDMRVKAQTNYFYPDVTIACDPRDFLKGTEIATLLNPTALIEVLSRSTEAYDRGQKFQMYQKIASLRDYILIAQDKPYVECFSRQEAGTWLLTTADHLGAVVRLSGLTATLPLTEIYDQIAFDDD